MRGAVSASFKINGVKEGHIRSIMYNFLCYAELKKYIIYSLWKHV